MDTYRLKLGPENLGPGAGRIDRRIAASLPVLGIRLRLQDVAGLLADGLAPVLAARPGPLHLLDIGGGPATDSLNALFLLRRDHPDLLAGRRIRIHVLDVDEVGPAFWARALAAVQAAGAPLHGIDAGLERVDYDWNESRRLPAMVSGLLPRESVVAVSSEGALFEYGSDEAVAGNLEALGRSTPADTVVAGSVTRDYGPWVRPGIRRAIPVYPRTREAFAALARRGGWVVDREIERPFSRNVRLRKGPAPPS